MAEREIQASRFKERCLALLDEVARTRTPIVVTKRGKAVAKLVPMEPSRRKPIRGSVTFLTKDEEELFSTGESWGAER